MSLYPDHVPFHCDPRLPLGVVLKPKTRALVPLDLEIMNSMCPPPLRVKTSRDVSGAAIFPSQTSLALTLPSTMNAFALADLIFGLMALDRSRIKEAADAQYGAPM